MTERKPTAREQVRIAHGAAVERLLYARTHLIPPHGPEIENLARQIESTLTQLESDMQNATCDAEAALAKL